jgi:hypothetical protein
MPSKKLVDSPEINTTSQTGSAGTIPEKRKTIPTRAAIDLLISVLKKRGQLRKAPLASPYEM